MSEINYPPKTRSITKPHVGKSRSIAVAAYGGKSLASRKGDDGKPPSKGVLVKGGGHG